MWQSSSAEPKAPLLNPPEERPKDTTVDDARIDEVGDARLVEQARDGNDDAFATLILRYERKLIRVLARLVHDEELARDLAQETFWKVYNRLDRFDTARRFGPWLFRIGVNLALDYVRSHSGPLTTSLNRAAVAGRDVGLSVDPADPDPRLREELAQEVRFILNRLPLPYRAILVLRDLEGFSSPEVAAIVGRQEATVRWRLAKARDLFRQHWDRRQVAAERAAVRGTGATQHGK
jgi:RNA polymerase sigma-70 factor (ECF subfamily)